jgi:hypothetical protein
MLKQSKSSQSERVLAILSFSWAETEPKTNTNATTCSAECMGCHPQMYMYCRSQASDMPSEWPPSGVTPGRPSTNQLPLLRTSLSLSFSRPGGGP